jgi:NCS2 family nucleobase:cation symporter-2
MYAGAIAVPLIVGRALKLSPEQVAYLISADLFCCGIVTLIQSLGATQWFGIRMPVMMGVSFASVAPMVAMANTTSGAEGAQLIFGAIIGAGILSMLLAPVMSRMLRFFPPVVTGTIIAVIGISLMRIGINWIFGNPFGPTAPSIVNPDHAKWMADVAALGNAVPPMPKGMAIVGSVPNPKCPDGRYRHCSRCAGVHFADCQIRERLYFQYFSLAGYFGGRCRGLGHGHDEL